MQDIYSCNATTLNGEEISLGQYKGQVLLIVNTASRCGFRKQLKEFEKIYREFFPKGFYVLGFPCDQFGSQEVCDTHELMAFYTMKYNVTFPMFHAIKTNGRHTHPLYKILKHEKPGFLGTEYIKWNFTKFLIDRNGNAIKRYSTFCSPRDIKNDIEYIL